MGSTIALDRAENPSFISLFDAMASTDTAESSISSSSSSSRCRYDVFLSFRGEDTRTNFTDHLYTALTEAKLHVFRDDDEIERGKNVDSELGRAIKQSRISMIVFSKNYASSRWCLDELVRILHQKKTAGQEVLPVFYDVSPSEVRKQTGTFQKAFEEHARRFKDSKNEKQGLESMQQWRTALKEAADLGGFVLENQADKQEARFIKLHILPAVIKKIHPGLLIEPPHLIGVDEQLADINSWLLDGSTEVSILAICGMSGIGKTAIAKAIYNSNYRSFAESCFLENIRETSEQFNGLVLLQRRLLSKIIVGVKPEIHSVDGGIAWITRALCCSRVLLVLDDVDQEDQLDAILRFYKNFYPGSKIIITTINKSLLRVYSISKLHMVEELGDKQSLELFSWHAFGQSHPIPDYMQLSRRVVNYCGGTPLALKVLGSALRFSDPNVWESALRQFEAVPHGKITERLKLSYDALPDERQKHLFLDIACFFVGTDKDYVRLILEKCELFPTYGLKILTERCLLTIDANNKLMMHQLLKDMGREIVRQESIQDPSERSRIWRYQDSFDVLKERNGSKKVRGLALDLRLLNIEDPDSQVGKQAISYKFKSDAFKDMQRLKFLQLNYVQLSGGFQVLSKQIRWLCWHGFPLKSLPSDLHLEKVVALDMRNSALEYAFNGIKFFGSMKILNLSRSCRLIKTPDFSGAPNLERISLKFCTSLIEIHESVTTLKDLVILNLKGCKSLRKLPEQIHQLESLNKLIISDCSKLTILPKDFGKLPSLGVLYADGINQLPVGCIGLPIVLPQLVLFWLSKLRRPPTTLIFSSLPKSLTRLSMKQCNISDDVLPTDLDSLSTLQWLNMAHNPFSSLPKSIDKLMMLLHLDIQGCYALQTLPELPKNLQSLNTANCKSLERLTNLPNLLTSLVVQWNGCPKIAEIQNMFRIEPIDKVDEEIMENLGLANVDTLKNQRVVLRNLMTREASYYPLQVALYEFGIFSIFLPGSEIPNWFNDNRSIRFSLREYSPVKDQVISFIVPSLPNLKLQGLNIGAVYSSRNKSLYSHVINITKDSGWVYSPTFMMVVGDDEDFACLSHWSIGHQLEAGDEMSICLSGITSKIEIHLIYYEQELEQDQSTQPETTHLSLQNLIEGGHLSSYQLSPGRFFLCHHHYQVFQNPVMSINSTILELEYKDQSYLQMLNFFFNGAISVNSKFLTHVSLNSCHHPCLIFLRAFFIMLAFDDDMGAHIPNAKCLHQFLTILSKLDPSSSSFQFDIAKMSKVLNVESIGTMLSWLIRCPTIFYARGIAMELHSLFPDFQVPQPNSYVYEMLDDVGKEIKAHFEKPQPPTKAVLALWQKAAPVLIEVVTSKQKAFAIVARLLITTFGQFAHMKGYCSLISEATAPEVFS